MLSPATVDDHALPASVKGAVGEQLRLTFKPPYESPITIAINGALMSSAWFFLPTGLRDKVFTLHGTLAFALVLAGWMYSDVPSTNILGPDATRIMAALDDPVMLRRLLYAKNIVLWLLVTPLCAVVAVVNGLLNHSLLSTVYTVVALAVIPFGVLAVSGWVGILFPYHPMPLRYRWEHRTPWRRMLIRWGTLAVTPYVLVPILATLMLAPSLLLVGIHVAPWVVTAAARSRPRARRGRRLCGRARMFGRRPAPGCAHGPEAEHEAGSVSLGPRAGIVVATRGAIRWRRRADRLRSR